MSKPRLFILAFVLLLCGCNENSMGGNNGCVTLRAGPPVDATDIADCAADKARREEVK